MKILLIATGILLIGVLLISSVIAFKLYKRLGEKEKEINAILAEMEDDFKGSRHA